MFVLTFLSASVIAGRVAASDEPADGGAGMGDGGGDDAGIADCGVAGAAAVDAAAAAAGAGDAEVTGARPSASARPSSAPVAAPEAVSAPRAEARNPALPEPAPLDVVVTGTRTPEQAQRATVKTDVVTREEAERRGATNVAEALATQPGVQVNPGAYGYLGQVSPIQMQGFDLGRVLILEDGEPVIGDVGGAIDLAAIPVADIDRIEIVTGPSSALYGSSAIGGVVNIITAPPHDDGSSGRGRTELRSHAGAVLQATGAQRGRRLWGVVDLGLARQGGVATRPGAPDLHIPTNTRTVVGLRAGARLTDRIDVQLRARWLRQRSDGLDAQTYPGLGVYLIDSPTTSNRFAGHALGTARFRDGSTLRLSLAGQRVGREAATIPRGSPLAQTQHTTQAIGSFEAIGTIGDGVRTWVVGARFEAQTARQGLTQTTDDGGGVLTTSTAQELAPRRLDSAAAYGQLRWMLPAGIQILPGLRAEYHEQFGAVVAPRLAMAMRPSSALAVRASVGRGFRAPSAKELGFEFDHSVYGYRVVGNPDLGPERSWGVNGDATWTVVAPLAVRAGAFASRVDDLIDTDLAGGMTNGTVVTYSYKNFERVRTFGAEGGVTVRGRRARADASYDYLWTRDDFNAIPLAGRPSHTFTASLQGALPGRFEALARARVTSDAYVDATTRSPGYATVDVRVARSIWNAIVYAGVLNLGDVHQQAGRVGDLRPPMGRVFYLGISAELPRETK